MRSPEAIGAIRAFRYAEISSERVSRIKEPFSRLMFIWQLPPAADCRKLIKPALEMKLLTLDIRKLPSIAEGEVFLKLTEAMPGASDIEAIMDSLSSTGPCWACPPAAAIARIREVILGSRDMLTLREAEPSAARVPVSRDEQEKSRKIQANSVKRGNNLITLNISH
jgi:hypothetical protein